MDEATRRKTLTHALYLRKRRKRESLLFEPQNANKKKEESENVENVEAYSAKPQSVDPQRGKQWGGGDPPWGSQSAAPPLGGRVACWIRSPKSPLS